MSRCKTERTCLESEHAQWGHARENFSRRPSAIKLGMPTTENVLDGQAQARGGQLGLSDTQATTSVGRVSARGTHFDLLDVRDNDDGLNEQEGVVACIN